MKLVREDLEQALAVLFFQLVDGSRVGNELDEALIGWKEHYFVRTQEEARIFEDLFKLFDQLHGDKLVSQIVPTLKLEFLDPLTLTM